VTASSRCSGSRTTRPSEAEAGARPDRGARRFACVARGDRGPRRARSWRACWASPSLTGPARRRGPRAPPIVTPGRDRQHQRRPRRAAAPAAASASPRRRRVFRHTTTDRSGVGDGPTPALRHPRRNLGKSGPRARGRRFGVDLGHREIRGIEVGFEQSRRRRRRPIFPRRRAAPTGGSHGFSWSHTHSVTPGCAVANERPEEPRRPAVLPRTTEGRCTSGRRATRIGTMEWDASQSETLPDTVTFRAQLRRNASFNTGWNHCSTS